MKTGSWYPDARYRLGSLNAAEIAVAFCFLSSTVPPMKAGSRHLKLLLVLMATDLAACTRTAALYRPPVASFAPRPTVDVEAAIYDGASRRKWIPTKLRDGEIQATLRLRSHMAVVDIEYDSDSFQVRYVRSENLNYEVDGGSEVIHPNYNAWVNNLISDIEAALQAQRAATLSPGGRRN